MDFTNYTISIIQNLETEEANEFIQLIITALRNANDTDEEINKFLNEIKSIDKRINL